MGLHVKLLLLISLLHLTSSVQSSSFTCTSKTTCQSIIDYVSPNTTTLSEIATLFQINNTESILGVNSLSASTAPETYKVTSKTAIRIPFPCSCSNGTGMSDKIPVYTVIKDDTLSHIATDIFSGLVTYQEIAAANGIEDPNKIIVGQKFHIPLPCSCDEVDGNKVVHYGYVVKTGNSVPQIAKEFGTTDSILLKLNDMSDPSKLLAGQVFDVPLKACTTMINSTSLDYPLLVANGTYTFTANNCVMCKCDAANNWTLQCQPSGLKPSKWSTCPSMECTGDGNLTMGNSTNSACGQTTCAYAGYTSEKILTTTSMDSTCSSGSGNDVSMVHLKNWSLIVAAVILTQFIML